MAETGSLGKLSLPNVTLTLIDRVCHDLAVKAVNDCLAKINFGDVVIISDKKLNIPGSRWYVRNLCDFDDVFITQWNLLPNLIKTSHFLVIQYDSWVLEPSMWLNKFLDYDYIGAPWPFPHGITLVGNGGFSLRSTELARWAVQHLTFKHPEDDVLCRQYRPQLEQAGFHFGPLWAAYVFAFEHTKPRKTFGFHGLFNWPKVLTPEALQERVALLPSIIKKGANYQRLLRNMGQPPDLVQSA